jgi:hypothetical protein
MNAVTKEFLNAMVAKVKVEVEKQINEAISKKIKENLDVLVRQEIISATDANEFAKDNGITIMVKRPRVSQSEASCSRVASCGSSISARRASC